MNFETLEKAKTLQRKIADYAADSDELKKGCGIIVKADGEVYIKTEREWSSKKAPDWFKQQINSTLYEYRRTLTEAKENLQTQLDML